MLKEWVINDLRDWGAEPRMVQGGAASSSLELAGVSGSYCWSCGLPLGACQYLFLIQVTISKGYKGESIWYGLPGKIK